MISEELWKRLRQIIILMIRMRTALTFLSAGIPRGVHDQPGDDGGHGCRLLKNIKSPVYGALLGDETGSGRSAERATGMTPLWHHMRLSWAVRARRDGWFHGVCIWMRQTYDIFRKSDNLYGGYQSGLQPETGKRHCAGEAVSWTKGISVLPSERTDRQAITVWTCSGRCSL